MVSAKTQKPTQIQRMAIICFVIIFIVSLGMVIGSSLGIKIENIQFWSDMLKYLIGTFVGFLFGANMRIKT